LKLITIRNNLVFWDTGKHSKIKQHYPSGTQEDYNSFSSRNLVMGKGTELEFPEGRGGGKGEPGVPPRIKLADIIC